MNNALQAIDEHKILAGLCGGSESDYMGHPCIAEKILRCSECTNFVSNGYPCKKREDARYKSGCCCEFDQK